MVKHWADYYKATVLMELTINQALQKAVEAHKAGEVQEADRLYTAILKAQPKHPDANHNMGVLAVGVGKVETALPFFKTALEANPNIAQFWLSYIEALIKLERLAEAKAVLDQAKSNGAKGDAFDQLEKTLASSPSTTSNTQEPPLEQLNSLVNLYNQNKLQQVFNEAKVLTKQYPNSLVLWNLMGASTAQLGQLDEAVSAFKKAISIKPDYADAHNNLGNALREQGNLNKAIVAFKKAISINPEHAEAYNNMGIAFKDQGKFQNAIKAFEKAISIKTKNAHAYNNMGAILKDQGKLDEAIEAYSKAVSINPRYAQAYTNTIELLKIHTPKSNNPHILFENDNRIKKLSVKLLSAKTNNEVVINVLKGLNYLSEDDYQYKTSKSQIYKRNSVDLNCKRHTKIFNTMDIIPKFCFECFKVQVEVPTVIDLIKITSIFYKFDFEEDLTKKTMIELRPNISGYYKGLIYCKGLDQAEAVKNLLDCDLKEVFCEKTTSKIKRGCSEYPLKFPNYGKITKTPKDMMRFPKEWKPLEEKFDQNELIEPTENIRVSLAKYCLSDFYIIQKWIDYAKGIGDQSVAVFNDMPIVFEDIYEAAKLRSMN